MLHKLQNNAFEIGMGITSLGSVLNWYLIVTPAWVLGLGNVLFHQIV